MTDDDAPLYQDLRAMDSLMSSGLVRLNTCDPSADRVVIAMERGTRTYGNVAESFERIEFGPVD